MKKRIHHWWWSMPDSQRTALILGPLALIGALWLRAALGMD